MLQDVIVTLVMLVAVAIVGRRLFGFAAVRDSAPGKASAGCDKCAMAPLHQGSAASTARATVGGQAATVHPVTLIRPSTSSRTTSA